MALRLLLTCHQRVTPGSASGAQSLGLMGKEGDVSLLSCLCVLPLACSGALEPPPLKISFSLPPAICGYLQGSFLSAQMDRAVSVSISNADSPWLVQAEAHRS